MTTSIRNTQIPENTLLTNRNQDSIEKQSIVSRNREKYKGESEKITCHKARYLILLRVVSTYGQAKGIIALVIYTFSMKAYLP